jgi:sulfite reductase beta subunit-like hemoprotein
VPSTTTFREAAEADILRFERDLGAYLAGELEEDVFRVCRLNNGIYGQRQGGHNQMVRVKAPYGAVTPEQLEAFARVASEFSRGWGHLTTRQNLQFHFVQLEQVPQVLRILADAGLTSREACGDTVRNITGCHLAGACPQEVLDISAWAEAAFQQFLRSPYAQRLPRKFKINFSGCVTDCGQAMFNDVGVVAVTRPLPDGTTEAGFRVFIAGGLGANTRAAIALEDFTPRDDLMPTIEATLRTFDHYGNRDNKLRARLKWVVDTMGAEQLKDRVLRERKFLRASATWPGPGIPAVVEERGDAPAGVGTGPVTQVGVPVAFLGRKGDRERWDEANVVRGRANGTVSAMAWCRLGDVTSAQLIGLAALIRETGGDMRITNRQNFVLRGLTEESLEVVYDRLAALGMAQPGAELARDVVACPGADTCNIAVTQSRGLASAIGEALEEAGLAEVGGVRVNISGCTNSCGQHHISDIGFLGVERRAHGKAAPGYAMLLGGRIGQTQVHFGEKALRLPAKAAAAATVEVVGRFAKEREAGELFADWLERSGGPKAIGKDLAAYDEFPSPEEAPDFYVDYGEQGPYVAEIGASECAT